MRGVFCPPTWKSKHVEPAEASCRLPSLQKQSNAEMCAMYLTKHPSETRRLTIVVFRGGGVDLMGVVGVITEFLYAL